MCDGKIPSLKFQPDCIPTRIRRTGKIVAGVIGKSTPGSRLGIVSGCKLIRPVAIDRKYQELATGAQIKHPGIIYRIDFFKYLDGYRHRVVPAGNGCAPDQIQSATGRWHYFGWNDVRGITDRDRI